MKKESGIIERNIICPLSLRERMGVAQVRGKINKVSLICTPSSALWASSPSRGKWTYGFTLIELLVVVLIIGILVAVAVPQYQLAVDKNKLSRLLPLMHHIRQITTVHLLAGGSIFDSLLDMGFEYAVTGESAANQTETFRGEYFTLQHYGNSYSIWPGMGNLSLYTSNGGKTWVCRPGSTSTVRQKQCATFSGNSANGNGDYPLHF